MKIGIIINNTHTEKSEYTTTRLALNAARMGHSVVIVGSGDLTYNPDGTISGFAKTVKKNSTAASYIKDLNSNSTNKVLLSELDVVLLRSDPAEEIKRPWAQHTGVTFGKLLANSGITVLNDPDGLSKAVNKMYFQSYPESVRPRTIISRNPDEIKAFSKEHSGKIVLKPLQGSGGQNVFLVHEKENANLNQMIEAISRDGYVIAQEYLPKAAEGDTRLFVMNGKPLQHKGKYAAFRRQRSEGDLRSNVHAGGKIMQAKITDEILELTNIVRPKLIRDGMFLVGLDIVDNKLMEINVFSPGGLGSAQKFEGVNFAKIVIESIEEKVRYKKYYDNGLENRMIATLE
ncbi:MAG: glutathione synthase [Ignavibacteria bacterium]|nr:glutathione synthase [Ignavibacteria bacterium]